MFSSVVQNSLQYLVFSAIVIVFGAMAEEVLPKILGVGVPILLAASCQVGRCKPVLPTVLFALAAGSVTDALSSLPPMTSAGFFLLVAMAAHLLPFSVLVMLVAFPLYQIWLALWNPEIGGEVFGRILLSVPMGMLTMPVVVFALSWGEKRTAVNEVG